MLNTKYMFHYKEFTHKLYHHDSQTIIPKN